ncbi:MAG: adenylyltransferase/cytidyltransferase family protein [Bacteroidetes bacterium]|jgi:pantetheine-phosphate adenylyltransferase|nr:adenylyltransferase/cytidyltransferase family protein [Bacteroidota bacterium]
MSDINYISKRLTDLKFPIEVLARYNESHRFYHTIDHLLDVISRLAKQNNFDDELFLAAVYHDAVYDPKAGDNEEQSANLFMQHANGSGLNDAQKKNIYQLIMDTKTHKASSDKSQLLITADLSILEQPFEKLVEYEHQIFREFQFVDHRIYLPKRIEILQKLNKNGKLDMLIEYVKQRKPLIGVFCGSFNPFHKGHYNVLEKAERIFDKVIVAFGKNPDKNDRTWPIPKIIQYHQMEEYTGLLTDFVSSLGYDVIVVRGLRNSTDFQYEQNQYRYIQELMPNIKIINIFCDKEFEHISSSGIRTLEKYDKHKVYLLD